MTLAGKIQREEAKLTAFNSRKWGKEKKKKKTLQTSSATYTSLIPKLNPGGVW